MKNDWAMEAAYAIFDAHLDERPLVSQDIAAIIRKHSAPRDAAVKELVEAVTEMQWRGNTSRVREALAAVREQGG